MKYILEIENLEKRYGKFKVINKLDMHIKKGSIYGLIGKNGAGKTTLIRIICGLQKPTSGKYFIYGVSNESSEISRSRQRIGAIIEIPSLCLDMTAEDNLKKQCKIVGVPNYNNLHNILKTVKLDNTGKKKSKEFFFRNEAKTRNSNCFSWKSRFYYFR